MITACMIARNEAKVIARCLEKIQIICDKIILVDSGSNDGTRDIAFRFGAEIICDPSLADESGRLLDFSAARNRSLSAAPDGWILSIDADEVLEVNDANELRCLLSDNSLHWIDVSVRTGDVRWYVPRLFRKTAETVWRDMVHEWIDVPGRGVRSDCVQIINLPDKDGKENAADRDLRLCELLLKQQPLNLRANFYMARALRYAERYEEAIPSYEFYIKRSDFMPGRYWAALNAAVCALMIGRFLDARRFALRAYRINPKLAEACCVLGDISLGLRRADLAEAWFRRALQKRLPGKDYPFFVDESSYSSFPNQRLEWIKSARAS